MAARDISAVLFMVAIAIYLVCLMMLLRLLWEMRSERKRRERRGW